MTKKKIGLALCGSYCTYDQAMRAAGRLATQYELISIMSENAARTDSRFGRAADFKAQLEAYTGKPVIETIAGAEPIGPRALLDLLLVAPCTGNTLAKIALGITDTSVTMACKAHLRNEQPLLIAISTNDGLSGNAENLGSLLKRKNVYFVPFSQDDAQGKPNSLVADFSLIEAAVEAALKGRQLQPILIRQADDK